MNTLEIWELSEMASHLCGVIQNLREDYWYTRADAVSDLEDYLKKYIGNKLDAAFRAQPPEYDCFAIHEENRLKEKEVEHEK